MCCNWRCADKQPGSFLAFFASSVLLQHLFTHICLHRYLLRYRIFTCTWCDVSGWGGVGWGGVGWGGDNTNPVSCYATWSWEYVKLATLLDLATGSTQRCEQQRLVKRWSESEFDSVQVHACLCLALSPASQCWFEVSTLCVENETARGHRKWCEITKCCKYRRKWHFLEKWLQVKYQHVTF